MTLMGGAAASVTLIGGIFAPKGGAAPPKNSLERTLSTLTCSTYCSPPSPRNLQVNVTENAKRESEAEHRRLTAALQHVMERYRVSEIKLRKDIRKAQ